MYRKHPKHPKVQYAVKRFTLLGRKYSLVKGASTLQLIQPHYETLDGCKFRVTDPLVLVNWRKHERILKITLGRTTLYLDLLPSKWRVDYFETGNACWLQLAPIVLVQMDK